MIVPYFCIFFVANMCTSLPITSTAVTLTTQTPVPALLEFFKQYRVFIRVNCVVLLILLYLVIIYACFDIKKNSILINV